MSVISAENLHKAYGDVRALDGFELSVEPGQIVGLIGPNGSGKTTALNAILGLVSLDRGDLTVMGRNPGRERASLMTEVAYIADTGILPRWMKVRDLLRYVSRVHPAFDLSAAKSHLARTDILLDKPVSVLSKGMHVQLHLAIVLAIDAPLLVLDEPTLGLDIIYRQQFYDALLNDYMDERRSILVTTHEVREIEHILTDVVFIHHGRSVLNLSTSAIAERFMKLTCNSRDGFAEAPLYSKQTLSGYEHVFRDVERSKLAEYGAVSTPHLAELFVAVMGDE